MFRNLKWSESARDISILLLLDLVFFGAVLVVYHNPVYAGLQDKIWSSFEMANGALFVLLNVRSQNPPNPPTAAA